jgi:hypothetical protein
MPKANILLSSARSGTNYFMSVYKKCFPDDIVVKEIFRKGGDSLAVLEELLDLPGEQILSLQETDPLALWRQIKAQAARQQVGAMAKIFYYHQPSDHPLWAHFRDQDRIVHLIRRNAFDVFVSYRMAQETGRWLDFGKSDKPPVNRIRLDVQELEAFLDQQRTHLQRARHTFADSDYAEVFYEDIAASVQACAARIETIFGPLQTKPPHKIGLRKQKQTENSDLVENYDEVAHLDTNTF